MRRLLLVAAVALGGCGSSARGPGPREVPAATSGSVSTAVPAPPRPRRGETLAAALRLRHTAVRAAPGGRARVLARLPRRTSFGSANVLPVVRQRGRWLGVLAPQLGNGRVGWVRLTAVRPLRETWAIDVDLSRHRGELLHQGRRYFVFPVAVGTSAYPTPRGRFGVTDRLRTGGPGSPYGCCVLALSGRQPHVAQDWPGGDRIAIHGTNEPWTIGTDASHGCLRATEHAMHLLMARVPLGTPVRIHA